MTRSLAAELRRTIAAPLKSLGFRIQGNLLWKRVNELFWVIFEVESGKRSGPAYFEFTVSAGVVAVDVLRYEEWELGRAGVPDITKAVWRQRIGRWLEPPEDRWWYVSDEREARDLGSEVGRLLVDIAPDLEQACDRRSLLELLKSSGGDLTKMKRLVYTAVLASAIDERSEVEAALAELAILAETDASAALAVSYHLRRLQQPGSHSGTRL
jgi:hypothetical protein